MTIGWDSRLLQAVLDNAGVGLMVQDRQRRILALNPAFEEITGWSWKEVAGRECVEVFGCHTSSGKCIINKFCPGVRVIEGEAPKVSRELIINKGNGEKRWVEVTVSAIKGDEGRVEYIVSILRDISEKKKYSEELLRVKTLATLGQLASELAHEIKNPLNSIQIQMLLLEREISQHKALPQEHIRELVNRVREEIVRLNDLTNSCLKFSSSGSLSLRYEALGPILEELVALITPQASLSGVRVELEVEEDLPPVMVDREKIRQALLNMVLNALEAMPDGGVLCLKAQRKEKGMKLVVKDTGYGIPEDVKDRVFELFYTTKKGGTGIGLPLAQNIVQAHGGYISFSTSEGGTEFVITLPLEKQDGA